VEQLTGQVVEWAVAARPLTEGEESGDACLVNALADSALVVVVDGLGHGPQAAAAARQAVAFLAEADQVPLLVALRHCHERLRSTRGAVLSLGRIDASEGTLTWVGVGNVMGVLLRPAWRETAHLDTLLLRRGVVGRHLPALHAATVPIRSGDVLVMATDGIDRSFTGAVAISGSPQQVADQILARHRTNLDDALVAVVRYRGISP